MLLQRMKTIIVQEHPRIEPYFPDKDGNRKYPAYRSINPALKDYRRFRREQVSLIESLDDATLDKSAVG